ncbi:nSTAND1 domain-containing NTPase [Leptolyngbya ohadii]|uniref:nSTAND1 domain-containing NTPase n=1 Tax=Leptolyngbya ohadii TaxID=1962290 RepID=UPI000B59CAC3|nr:caspase family protein [Leptolyngbya ohadii]
MGTPEFRLNLAVVIGINHYQNGIPPLGTARSDAEAIAEILQSEYQYQVTLITDATHPSPTRQNLKHWLEVELPAAVTQVTPSRLLFYFAGHGIALNGDEGPQGYLIPQDARLGDASTYLSMQEVEAALSQLACRHCLVILDCCFAGAFRWSSTRKLVAIPQTIHKERYDRFIQDPAWQVITSAASDQYALDNLELRNDRGTAPQDTQHSPFAAALVDALRGAADIYPPSRSGKPAGDGIITATELYLYLRDAIEVPTDHRHHRQTPQIWCLKQHDKGEFIFLPPGHPLNLPAAPSLDELEANNPYRGLKSYEVQDSALFFGRTALIETLCDAVSDRPLTIVLGASGSGKSSLVKAGLIPHLDRLKPQHHPCKQSSWKILPPLRPGESPLNGLVNSLNSLLQEEIIGSSETPDPTAIKETIAAWSQSHPQTQLLLVIDQLEELITLCQQESERQQFLAVLAALLEIQAVHLVMTLRSDFEPQFRNTPLEPQWQAGRFVVPPMTRDELQAVIEEPASAKVVYFESSEPRGDLVNRLIDEVAGMPGALPLLSFTLSELYLKLARRYQDAQITGDPVDRSMTWADYDDLGGVTQSLTRRADEIYDALVESDRAYAQTIRHVMLRLVAVGSELARRRVPEAELRYPEPENTRVQTAIDRFSSARLLVRGTDAENIPYIEPAHDALVRGWQKLLTWKKEEEEKLILQRRLTPAAFEWAQVRNQHREQPKGVLEKAAPLGNWIDRQLLTIETTAAQISAHLLREFQHLARRTASQQPKADRPGDKPTHFLWDSNPYLSVLDQELHANDLWFNQIEGEFVRESVLQKRRNVSWRWRIVISVIAGLSGLTAIALIGQRSALINQIQASRESAEANFRAGQSLNAFLDALRAAHSFNHPLLQVFQPSDRLQQEVQGSLQKAIFSVQERNRLDASQGIARSIASPNGRLIASAGEDGRVVVWNWQGQKQTEWDSGQGHILNVSFSPDSQTIATAGGDSTVRLWDLQGNLLAQLQGHTDMVKGLSFSPNGRWLASSGRDRTVRLWNLQDRSSRVFSGHEQDVWSVAFSPDSQTIASAAEDKTFRLWDLQGNLLKTVPAGEDDLHTIRFSPDGQILAVGGDNGYLSLWDLQGQRLANLPGHQRQIWNVAFSPDGTRLTSAAGDSRVWLWSRTGQAIAVFQGHAGPARSVSFSADGQRIVSSGDDGTVRLWDLQGQQQVTLKGHQGSVQAIQFSPANRPNGQQLVTSGEDATIRLWNLQGESLATVTGDLGAVRSIAFHPNGQQIASAQGQTVRLWTGSEQPAIALEGHQGLVRSVQFSPDGQQIISSADDGSIRRWSVQGQPLANWRADQQRVWQVAFSPDGQQIASAGQDGVVRLWDLQGQPLVALGGHLGSAYSVAFSPDGKRLASSGQDGTIRLWDLQNRRQSHLFQLYDAEVNSVAFSPDGKFLASGDNFGNAQLWNLQIQQQAAEWIAHPNAIVRRVTFSPDSKLVATASDDGTAKLWRLEAFDPLLSRGCNLLSDYLNHRQQAASQAANQGDLPLAVVQSDRTLCNAVRPPSD